MKCTNTTIALAIHDCMPLLQLLKADEGDFMESIQSSLSDHSRECLRSESKNEGEGLGDDIPSKAEEKKGEGTSDGNASQESATRESFREVMKLD